MNKEFAGLIQVIEDAQIVGLITHARGDGDAFGSMLAFAAILKKQNKEVVIFSNEPLPDYLDFLEEKIEYNPLEVYGTVDLLICLDGNSKERMTLPEVVEAASTHARVAVIDHHQGGDFSLISNLVIVDTKVSSTAEMVYRLADNMSLRLDRITATLLYLGLMWDTGSLQFDNTSKETLRVAGELLKMGAMGKKVTTALVKGRTNEESKILGLALSRISLSNKYPVSTTFITQDDLKKVNLDDSSGSGLANYLDQTKEGKVVLVLVETDDGKIKVSMRSNRSNVNVAKIAEICGGGGHEKAAGFMVSGKIKDLS
jgi:bifunctional oligoribonuclease and PAP phosphatase NrnA